jgi:uncharacterized membrane protein
VIDTLVTWAHALGWSFHFGGALLMEVVWRPAQLGMPQSQIGVACQWMGRRYRWLSAGSLGVLGISGAVMAVRSEQSLSLAHAYGRLLAVLVALWLALAVVLTVLALSAHPGLHARMAPDASDEERRAARAQVARAIVRMDRLLRLELALSTLALLVGAGLHVIGST